MGEFPVYTNDVQGPGDILKLFRKFGCRRTMKFRKAKYNLGMSIFNRIDFPNGAN